VWQQLFRSYEFAAFLACSPGFIFRDSEVDVNTENRTFEASLENLGRNENPYQHICREFLLCNLQLIELFEIDIITSLLTAIQQTNRCGRALSSTARCPKRPWFRFRFPSTFLLPYVARPFSLVALSLIIVLGSMRSLEGLTPLYNPFRWGKTFIVTVLLC